MHMDVAASGRISLLRRSTIGCGKAPPANKEDAGKSAAAVKQIFVHSNRAHVNQGGALVGVFYHFQRYE